MDQSFKQDPDSGHSPARRYDLRAGWGFVALFWLIATTSIAWLQAPRANPQTSVAERTLWDTLVHPIEANALTRLPSAPAGLVHVYAHGNRTAWAVGAGGTILTTNDGGNHWSAQSSGVDNDLHSITFAADGQHGWVVGGSGLILSTSNGGRTWAVQISGVPSDLQSVAFAADGQHGWAVGAAELILTTTDAGAHWTRQANEAKADLNTVFFSAEGQRGWVGGAVGTILATTDGGESWIAQHTTTKGDIWSIHFAADDQHGWAVGSGGVILATSDGGNSWSARNSGVQTDLWSIMFSADSLHGLAVGNDGDVLSTSDGGTTWSRRPSGIGNRLASTILADDGRHGWAVGDQGTILATSDGGQSWDAQSSSGATKILSITFATDEKLGWAVGGGGLILATVDGGHSWTAQSSGVKCVLEFVSFASDGRHGWVAGRDGTILATTDGGHSWAPQKTNTQIDLWSVAFAKDGQRGWAVGDAGIILATIDGGRTWSAQERVTKKSLRALAVSGDGQRAWAAGASGAILATIDGGRTWTPQSSNAHETLWGIVFDSNGSNGWIVGTQGTILSTTDGGETWANVTTPWTATLYSLAAGKPEGSLVAAGAAGTILLSSDGGKTWTRQDSKVGSSRISVSVNGDGRRIWAVGYPPALLHSDDSGQTWTPEPWPLRYSRFPAPWYWLSLLALPFFLRLTVRRADHPSIDNAEALAASDAPTQNFDQDRLQFGPLARGLSRFLRNPSTEPPLTVAVSGDWGSGKSSLMQLVCRDLRRYGCRPVWFNAWHHQNDDQLLAALLVAIKNQALPPWFSLDGLVFRTKLVWLRSAKHFVFAAFLAAMLTATAAFMANHESAAWQRLGDSVTGALHLAAKHETDTASSADWFKLLGPAASLLMAWIALWRALKAFGADPAVLLTSTSETFNLKEARAATDFRAKFAEQFREVAEALPYRMIIVVDDLDRCKAEAVLNIMEGVNFLITSGRCFVIFGMATHRVQAALSMSFEKIAKELVELDLTKLEDGSPPLNAEEAERKKRHVYAADYLEKLINLVVQVPSRDDLPLQLLVPPSEQRQTNSWHIDLSPVANLLPLAALVAALGLGWMFGWTFEGLKSPPPSPVIQVALPNKPGIAGPGATATPHPGTPEFAHPGKHAAPLYTPSVQHGDEREISVMIVAAPAAFALVLMTLYGIMRLRESTREVKDSKSFLESLRAWVPIIYRSRPTPRAVKRFGNRVRYLAMLQQAEHLDESGWDVLRGRFMKWLPIQAKPPVAQPGSSSLATLQEHRIVALGAFHEVFGENWRQYASQDSWDESAPEIGAAIRAYTDATKSTWPASNEELDAFERALKGVRLAGDPAPLPTDTGKAPQFSTPAFDSGGATTS